MEAQKPAAPTLEELLSKGAAYQTTYATKVSGVTLEEQWVLIEVVSNKMATPLRISSDVVLVALGGELVGLRDLFSVDGKPVREHQPRIVKVLTDQPTSAGWQAAQRYQNENTQNLAMNTVVWYSDPMLAWQFIAEKNQSRMAYKLEGNKKMNGVQVYGVGFKEAPGGSRLIETPSRPLSSGRFWIDPATGAVHMTELWIQSETDTARIQVAYAPDAKLSILLPKEATHSFETREAGAGFVSGGRSTQKMEFQASAKYKGVSQVPLDLSKLKR